MQFKPKNWDKFQHYKDRSPPWIKLHRDLLDNRNYWNLSPVAAKYLPLIWLISSEKDGLIPDNDDLAFRLRISVPEAKKIVEELSASQFLINVSDEEVEQSATNAQSIAAQNGYGSRHISDKTKRQVWDRDEGKCQDCGAVKNIEYDHIMPVSKGGGSNIENIQLLCRPCNRKKRAKTAEQAATQKLNSRILETEREGETEKETKKALKSAPPDGVSDSLWNDFLAIRKAKKLPVTDTAIQGLKREAASAGKTLSEALTICCERGWGGFNAKWLEKDLPAGGSKQLTMQEELALRARAKR